MHLSIILPRYGSSETISMDNSAKQIMLDCERMKYDYTGLYYYCLHLAKNLDKVADAKQEVVNYYLPKNAQDVLDKKANNLQQSSLHKFVLPSLKEVRRMAHNLPGNKLLSV